MREIKFRGKHLDNGEWIYGDLYHTNDLTCICDWSIRPHTVENFAVDPATVGQYTGLKDKNGKEIYEGDVVCIDGGRNFSISFSLRYGWMLSREKFSYSIQNETTDSAIDAGVINGVSVIGNIHDNPELIKKV